FALRTAALSVHRERRPTKQPQVRSEVPLLRRRRKRPHVQSQAPPWRRRRGERLLRGGPAAEWPARFLSQRNTLETPVVAGVDYKDSSRHLPRPKSAATPVTQPEIGKTPEMRMTQLREAAIGHPASQAA